VYEAIILSLDFTVRQLYETKLRGPHELKKFNEARKWIALVASKELEQEVLKELLNKLN